MLRNILEGKESSKLILIKDSIQQSGRNIVKSFIVNLLSRVDKVHLVIYDVHVKQYVEGLPEVTKGKLQCHDGYSDPLGWYASSSDVLTMTTDLHSHLRQHTCGQDSRVAVVIDSLSPLLLRQSSPYTCSTLHQLKTEPLCEGSETVQVVSLVHEDLHDESTIARLQHIMSSVATVSPPASLDYHGGCELLHCRESGKIFRTKEHYLLSRQFLLEETEEIRGTLNLQSTESTTIDPAANLTFNLTLKDSEKEARSHLQLPYMHHKRKPSPLDSAGPVGKIFYQPDKDDDFDEEDPDDDLDI